MVRRAVVVKAILFDTVPKAKSVSEQMSKCDPLHATNISFASPSETLHKATQHLGNRSVPHKVPHASQAIHESTT